MKTIEKAVTGIKKKAPKRTWPRKVLTFLVAAVVLVWLVNGLRPKPMIVDVAQVKEGPLTVTVLEEGKTRVRNRYVIAAPVPGFLQRVELKAGARVEAGKTVLAVIRAEASSFLDPRARTQGEASVQAAQALVSQRQAAVERAKAELDLAEKELKRGEELLRKGAMAQREWDTMESQQVVRTRDLRTAEFGLSVAQFELEQRRAALMQGTEELGTNMPQFELRSPVDGYVLNVYQESARVVISGTPIMEVGDVRDLEIEAEILSQDAAGIQPGAAMWVEQWGGEKALQAKVRVVEPAAFTKISALGVEEQRVKVIADFAEEIPPNRFLGDRYRVETRVVTWHSDKVVTIPAGALFRRGGEWMTFAVEGNKTYLREVKIGHNNGIDAEVLSGVKNGDQVILHPPDLLKDGSWIEVRK